MKKSKSVSWLRTRRMWVRMGLALLTLSPAAQAQAVPVEQCVEAHEQSQLAQADGKLLEARSSLLICSNESCPAVVRNDCVSWYTQVGRDIPSLSVSARRGNDDILNGKLSIDGKVVSESLDGREHELNPGRHMVVLEVPGEEPMEKEVLIAKGQKSRIVQFELKLAESAAPAESTGNSEESAKDETPTYRPVPVLTYVLAGGAVAGLTVGTIFGVVGMNKLSSLEESCAPYCTEDEKSSVDSKLLIADIGFGVGIAAGVGALVTYLLRPRVPVPSDSAYQGAAHATSAGQVPISVGAGPRGASLSWSGQW